MDWRKSRALYAVLILLLPYGLFALRLPSSARAVALQELNIGSDSDQLFDLQPGIRFAYQNLFSIADIGLYNFEGSVSEGTRLYTTALSQLSAPDYTWQDYQFGIVQRIGIASLGIIQHLKIETIHPDEAHKTWFTDIGMSIRFINTSVEFQSLSVFSDETEYKAMLNHQINQDTRIGVGYFIDEYNDSSTLIGSSYMLTQRLELLSSWRDEPSSLGLGIGLNLAPVYICYAVRSHPKLNLSHAFDLSFRW